MMFFLLLETSSKPSAEEHRPLQETYLSYLPDLGMEPIQGFVHEKQNLDVSPYWENRANVLTPLCSG